LEGKLGQPGFRLPEIEETPNNKIDRNSQGQDQPESNENDFVQVQLNFHLTPASRITPPLPQM
jgi:hypothetical protein